MATNHDILYIKCDRNVEITKRTVTLGDIAVMEIGNKTLLSKLKTMTLFKISEDKKQRYVISVLKIIECIHEKYPNLEVQSLGEPDMIVTYESKKTPSKWFHIIKAGFVTIVIFFGAAFSMMAFNNDVDITNLFDQIYIAVTGEEAKGFTMLELTYSIGVAVGSIGFFNHFGKRRFTVDPTPIEIEMRLYENDIQTTLIEAASRKGEELDVGKATPTSNHRT